MMRSFAAMTEISRAVSLIKFSGISRKPALLAELSVVRTARSLVKPASLDSLSVVRIESRSSATVSMNLRLKVNGLVASAFSSVCTCCMKCFDCKDSRSSDRSLTTSFNFGKAWKCLFTNTSKTPLIAICIPKSRCLASSKRVPSAFSAAVALEKNISAWLLTNTGWDIKFGKLTPCTRSSRAFSIALYSSEKKSGVAVRMDISKSRHSFDHVAGKGRVLSSIEQSSAPEIVSQKSRSKLRTISFILEQRWTSSSHAGLSRARSASASSRRVANSFLISGK
mmetsp:Transcript_25852/g.62455  ORF Transcript_25852/g.62455 Transcript_25852/m.62455 type:complete len:281 (-) Transcript_25852:1004-1846(-)